LPLKAKTVFPDAFWGEAAGNERWLQFCKLEIISICLQIPRNKTSLLAALYSADGYLAMSVPDKSN